VSASSAHTVNASTNAATITLRSTDGTGLKGAASWTAASMANNATVATTGERSSRTFVGRTQWPWATRVHATSAAKPKITIVASPG
jgi:hypothetical protein